MRKLLTILLLLAAGISASAQYIISSVDRTFSPEFELKYILEADDGILEPKYKRFYIKINNDSDHGVLFSFDETYVVGHRIVGGKQQDKYFTKYTAQSFDGYMGQSDYEEARRHAGVMGEVGRQLRSDSYNRGNGEWANLGLKVLSYLAFKNQKADSFTLHIPMDGYDFTFEWK